MLKSEMLKESLLGNFSPEAIVVDKKDSIKIQLLLDEHGFKYETMEGYDLFIVEEAEEHFKNMADYDKIEESEVERLADRMVDIIENGYFNEYGEYPEMNEAIEEFVEDNSNLLTYHDDDDDYDDDDDDDDDYEDEEEY
jgi:hypothetical protein